MADTLSIPFDNSYAALPPVFYTRRAPVPVKAPRLIRVNRALAEALGIDPDALEGPEGVATLAGNHVPEGAAPLAQVYAGHQFGGWAGRLGDGRAVLLGEVVGRDGQRRDIQLKGSGPTPYSRMGDGRAWLGPVLREYVVSEAMAAMGIPTTRALAAVETGETVLRERPLPGAILTRVAASHIRVGTFQYFAAAGDEEALRLLTDHAIARHWPEAQDALEMFAAVVDAQARLVARWLSVGFIHGVMNTDNTTISGETIDYGPCAFMDRYEPGKVFSSIDQFGRYAYNRQPDVMMWNLAQFATALLPLMGDDRQAAVDAATGVLNGFASAFQSAWRDLFRAKIGIGGAEDGDSALIHRLLDMMTAASADFTNTFRDLGTPAARDHFLDREAFDQWEADRQARAARSPDPQAAAAAMSRANPALTPRNHRVEEAITAATGGDYAPFERLLEATARPFDPLPGDDDLRRPPEPEEEVRQTFCGT